MPAIQAPPPHPLNSRLSGPHWRRVGIGHHHGVNIPLFSLKTHHSCGTGEFTDLIPLFDWCGKVGFDVVQLLPLNDRGYDSSPYNACSAFALDPLYLGLHHLPGPFSSEEETLILSLQSLNSLPRIDLPKVRSLRERFLWTYLCRTKSSLTQEPSYPSWIASTSWLDAYCAYKVLWETHNLKPWSSWPRGARKPTRELIEQLDREHPDRMNHYRMVQYLCHKQMQNVRKAAEERGILIKGDIPILVSPDSADVWEHNELFQSYLSAGAPPDDYAKDGQVWGFPLYDWQAMERSNYRWWEERLKSASAYYHLYRLDHIVGFFRIWAVAPGQPARSGAFLPPDPDHWLDQGRSLLLMMLEACPMLPIGEDLGVIPRETRECMSALGICGTKVLRWEKDSKGNFLHPKDFPAMSMSTVGTHDSEGLREWWETFPKEAQDLCKQMHWSYEKSLHKDLHRKLLRLSHQSGSFFHINLLSEYLALNPHWRLNSPQDERINVPGICSESNWTHRMGPYVEDMLQDKSWMELVHKLVNV